MEGKFLQFPGRPEGKTFIRKKKDEPQEKFDNVVKDHERRIVGRGESPAFKILREYEVKKTPEQREVLNFVIEQAEDFIGQYGVESQNIRPKDIYIEKEKFWEKTNLKDAYGVSMPLIGAIAIRQDENRITNSTLAARTYHELMHNAAFGRLAINKRRAVGHHDWIAERGGVTVGEAKRGNAFLGDLNEAITAELEHRFMQENKDHPLFKEDFWKIKHEISRRGAELANSLLEEENEEGVIEYFTNTSYARQRRKMHLMFDEIAEKNPDQFQNSEQVFEVFLKAYFSGRLLEISRLLKKTYGNRPLKEIIKEKGL